MMGRIMGLARSLGGQREDDHTAPEQPSRPSVPPSGEPPDPLSLFGSIDPKFLDMAVRVMNTWQSGDDRRTNLLCALRPFVKEERYAKLDQAVRITKLTQAVRTALDALRTREGGAADV